MRNRAARTAFATWVAISLLGGMTVGFLRLTNAPSEQLYDSGADEIVVGGIVWVWWSVLTFVCGVPLVWAAVALKTRIRARTGRRHSARQIYDGAGKL